MPHTSTITPKDKLKALTAAFLVVCATALIATLTGITYLVYADLQQSEFNAKELKQITQTNRRLRDCTVPAGGCYQRSQESTAAAVGTINTSAVYAAFCADKPEAQTVAEIKTCILEQFQKEREESNE